MYSLLPDDTTTEASLVGKGLVVIAPKNGRVTRWDTESASALLNAVDDEGVARRQIAQVLSGLRCEDDTRLD
jgi:hypothetical protein